MAIAALDETVVHGSQHAFRLEVINERTEAVANIGLWTDFWCTAKFSKTDEDADAVFQYTVGDGITVLDSANGLIEVVIDCSILPDASQFGATQHLYMDVRGRDSTGCPWTLAMGRLTVLGEVTWSQA